MGEHTNKVDPSRRELIRHAGLGLMAAGVAGAAVPPLAPPDKQPPKLAIPEPAPKKVGYAIVGLGELALKEVMPAFGECEYSRPVALVSGHPEKAQKVASHYGIDPKRIYSYENYDRMADDPAIEVVYVILPNSMHAEFTIRALKAGKHVLCEKPMAPTPQECQSMIDAATSAQRKLMIAYRLHYEPFNQSVIEMCRKQAFGPIRLFEASNLQDTKAPNIRLSKQTAGGALGDVGIYCLNAARYVTGEEPLEVSAWTHASADDPRFREVEESILFNLRFPSGVMAMCSAGFSSYVSRRYRVNCTDGFINLDRAFGYRGQSLKVAHGDAEQEREFSEEIHLRSVNHFAKEMDHMSQCVTQNQKPWTPGEEGLRDIRLIEKIYEAARERKSVKV